MEVHAAFFVLSSQTLLVHLLRAWPLCFGDFPCFRSIRAAARSPSGAHPVTTPQCHERAAALAVRTLAGVSGKHTWFGDVLGDGVAESSMRASIKCSVKCYRSA